MSVGVIVGVLAAMGLTQWSLRGTMVFGGIWILMTVVALPVMVVVGRRIERSSDRRSAALMVGLPVLGTIGVGAMSGTVFVLAAFAAGAGPYSPSCPSNGLALRIGLHRMGFAGRCVDRISVHVGLAHAAASPVGLHRMGCWWRKEIDDFNPFRSRKCHKQHLRWCRSSTTLERQLGAPVVLLV